jgi:proteasome lid subunit RPN8/RPN11
MSAGDPTIEVPGLDGTTRERVYDHVFRRTDREVGGVLVGQVGRRGGPPLVTGSIEAVEATEHLTTLTFTQASWEHVHRVMAQRFPEDQIVGWYHSHPGHGVFLSEQDLFIHRNFFADPSQIAWVIDPVAGTEGVFGWRTDDIVEWYRRPTTWPGVPRGSAGTPLPTPREEPAVRRAPRPARSSMAPAPEPRRATARAEDVPVLVLLGLLLAGVLLGFGLWEGVLRGDPEPHAAAPTVTVVQAASPPARSSTAPATSRASTTTPAPERVSTTKHETERGSVKTYTVHDPSAVLPPLPDSGDQP